MTADMLLYAPADLIELAQWVLWRYEEVNGKRTKVPYQVNGKKASSTDLAAWNEFSIVFERWQKCSNVYNGIGFVFSGHDPFCGIDLDKSLDSDGNVKAWARDILERFHDTYAEISPSGAGIKIWCKGTVPKGAALDLTEGSRIELYCTGRYFTVTGRKFRGAPDQIEDHAADVMTLYERLTGRHGTRHEVPPDGKIPNGERHKTLVSLCGTLRRRGVCDQAVEACLQAVNHHQCDEPKPPSEITKIVASTRVWSRP